jgi:hypothetical protein
MDDSPPVVHGEDCNPSRNLEWSFHRNARIYTGLEITCASTSTSFLFSLVPAVESSEPQLKGKRSNLACPEIDRRVVKDMVDEGTLQFSYETGRIDGRKLSQCVGSSLFRMADVELLTGGSCPWDDAGLLRVHVAARAEMRKRTEPGTACSSDDKVDVISGSDDESVPEAVPSCAPAGDGTLVGLANVGNATGSIISDAVAKALSAVKSGNSAEAVSAIEQIADFFRDGAFANQNIPCQNNNITNNLAVRKLLQGERWQRISARWRFSVSP